MKGEVHGNMYFGLKKKKKMVINYASFSTCAVGISLENGSLGLCSRGFWPFTELNLSELLLEAFGAAHPLPL